MSKGIATKRSAVKSLDWKERLKIFNSEYAYLSSSLKEKKISLEEHTSRNSFLQLFLNGNSNCINSDGVWVEFYVEEDTL